MARFIDITLAAPGTSNIYPIDGNMDFPVYTVHVTSVTGGGSVAVQGNVKILIPGIGQ